ncbi:unnamed protein product [Peronospora effusa]|nr:unnamed protein product [Peronospora effusa]
MEKTTLLMGKGNALPPAARGAVCDIDAGNARPIAQRVRKVAPQFREKLADLIKGLLSSKIIQHSTSPWASPIVIIVKKNGVDIRLCIDYRMVNDLTRLMVYPMPLVNELLEDLDKALWYCSLDMASGFWVWRRMPFGLKNAPQIYQRLLDNALYGFLTISSEPGSDKPEDLFEVGHPEGDLKKSILGRRSYIDDILVTSESWDDLCVKVERLLEVCDKWNLSISAVKSSWGCQKVDYLGHQVSAEGLEAHPKDLQSLVDLPLPTTLKAMQSFLGSLNYYSRFLEDYAIYASILYELREVDYHVLRNRISRTGDIQGDDQEEDRWARVQVAFAMLKNKIATAPILRHFDPDREPVIIVYASEWAISASLVQEYEGVYMPVTFTIRTLKPNEINYGLVDKEVLALLRILDLCYTSLVTRPIKAALLSQWTLEVVKCKKGEDEILGTLAASITPRENVDSILSSIAPKRHPRQAITVVPPTVEPEEVLYVVSFDGSARVKRGGGACSAIVWQVPEWTVVAAASRYLTEATVNEAEYEGLLLGFLLLENLERRRLVVCGDSNLVVRQMRGEIECKAQGLTVRRAKALEKLRSWPVHEFLHMKREWNQSADRLANAALQQQRGVEIIPEEEWKDLEEINRLPELLVPKNPSPAMRITAVTRSRVRSRMPTEVVQEGVVQRIRIERISAAQDEKMWIRDLKLYLRGEWSGLPAEVALACGKIETNYALDEDGLLLYCPGLGTAEADRDGWIRLVIPESLQQDFLHHYHKSLEGGHQGIGRTYQRIRRHFYWRGLFRSVQRFVGTCVDCETGKGGPTLRGKTPGNVRANYPFQVIAMDHIPSLPKSFKGNTELLIWVDLFTGYVIAKSSSSRSAQTVAEGYEECVFRRFGASEAIRHDREPSFMSDFFRAFNRMIGQKQRATMA